MYASGVKARQAPTVMVNAKRQKLDTADTTAQPRRRSTRSDVVAKRNGSVTTTTTSVLRETSNRNITKSKLTAPSTTKPSSLVNNQGLKSLKSSPSSISTDTVTSRRLAMMSQKELPNRLSTTKKSNGLPLLGAAVRSKIPSTTNKTSYTGGDTTRLWNRNASKNPSKDSKSSEELLAPTVPGGIEMGIQTQETEILNHSLLVGDIKFLNPSKHIVEEIEKIRNNLKTKQMLKATRKFEEHSQRQEEHLTDLKEFLEKSYVTKKQRPPTRDSFGEDRKLFNTMDQLFNQAMTKTESITDIKARIKRKEEELSNLFDNVESTARLIMNNN